MDRTIVRCEQCGKIYTARKYEDELIIPTRMSVCECGSDAFTDVVEQQFQSPT